MNLDEVLHYRRSVRAYDETKLIDPERIKHYLELATLAPNSSDMQLWEFYHITQPELLAKVSRACLDQKATSLTTETIYEVFLGGRDCETSPITIKSYNYPKPLGVHIEMKACVLIW